MLGRVDFLRDRPCHAVAIGIIGGRLSIFILHSCKKALHIELCILKGAQVEVPGHTLFHERGTSVDIIPNNEGQFAGTECRYYVLLCDGMGTGEAAARDAQTMGNMLRHLLAAGYPAAYALRSINSICALQGRAGAVTLDLAELRLDTGKVTLYKWGAAPSYVISRGEPIRVGTATPPPGLSVTDGRETVQRLSLRRGETLVLLSDGVGGEESLRRGQFDENVDAGILAAHILEDSPGESDDATVAVIRLHGTALST